MSARLADCKIVTLPRVSDPRGNLTYAEGGIQVPFEIKRVFYLSDVPQGKTRSGHSHKRCFQLIAAVTGSFDLVLDDGHARTRMVLNTSDQAVLIPPGIWRDLENFSPGAVCLVLASEPFDEGDYCRSYSDFLGAAGA